MLRLDIEKLLKEESINKVQFNNKWYFDIDSLSVYLKEDLSDVACITLPFDGEYKKASTITDIEAGRKQEELSEFNKALLKMKNSKKD